MKLIYLLLVGLLTSSMSYSRITVKSVKSELADIKHHYNKEVTQGTLSNNILISSSHLGYDCQYRVYTPANYDLLSNLSTVYLTDGQNYLAESMGKMISILDNLIGDGSIDPIIAVFLDPRDPNNLSNDRRGNEYRNNPQFASYVTTELIPVIDAAYKTSPLPISRAIMGASYGAYNALYFSVLVSDFFNFFSINSAYLHPANAYDIDSELRAANLDDLKFYLSYGTQDADGERYFNRIKTILDEKGKEYEYDIVNYGHTWQNWSSVADDALEYFFGRIETHTLSIISPKGGEYFIPGEFASIIWENDSVPEVKIEYSTNSGSDWIEIIANTSSDSNFNWLIPDVKSNQCLIRISDISRPYVVSLSAGDFEIGPQNSAGGPFANDDKTQLMLHFNNNLINSSILSDDGIASGPVTYGTSVNSSLGKCVYLDGNNGSTYIAIPHSENLNLTGDWTIEMWFKATIFNSIPQYFITKPGDTEEYFSNFAMQLNPYWDNILFSFYFEDDTRIGLSDFYPELNQWYHIDFIRDTENAELLTVIRDKHRRIISSNNEPDPGTNPLTNAQDLLIGKDFIGYIDEVRISSVIRSIDEALYADFTADETSGESSLEVNFTDLSTGNPISWEWDFDNDGTIDSYDQNPGWLFGEPGNYTISLTVSDGINSDSEIKTNYILAEEEELSILYSYKELYTIYPNPCKETIYVSSPEKINLSILSITGQKIWENKNFQSGAIDISGFSRGVFFVIFSGETEITIRQLIIE